MTKVAAFILAGIILVWLVRNWWQRHNRARQRDLFQQAVDEFPRQIDLTKKFLAAANATGKPRGLRWISCELQGQPIFATNEATNEIFGLSGAAIGFEAIPGGDMEEVEAVGDIRYVTAIFQYRNGEWQTDGRAIFNLEPAQALARLGETLKPKG